MSTPATPPPADPLPPDPSPAAGRGGDEPKKGGGENLLTGLILASIVAALVLAWLAPHAAASLKIGGDIFLSLLKMLVVPLVLTSVTTGVLGMGDVRKLGKPGAATLGYYLLTTVLAVALGLAVVNVVRPAEGTVTEEQKAAVVANRAAERAAVLKIRGAIAESAGVDEAEVGKALDPLADPPAKTRGDLVRNLVLMLFTDNLLASAVNGDLLPLIVFSLAFGAILTTLGARAQTVRTLVTELNDALLAFVLLLMWAAPVGIFCLVAGQFGAQAADGTLWATLKQTAWYSATVLIGLGLHGAVTLPVILWVVTRRNPYRFMFQMSRAVLTAFATASSSATLPVTMQTAVEEAGIKRRSVDFVLPLGATINMDGTALYEAVAAIFIAGAAGIELSFADQMTVAVTATLAAVGAAGIPQAGLVTMLIVLNAVGLPLDLIGLILSVDWLLDRFRTAINVFGDATGAAVVERAVAG